MNKLHPKNAKDIKGAVAIAELRRAHLIIVILAISLAVVLGFGMMYESEFSIVLRNAAIILLAFVALASLATAYVLGKR
jgi:hypothetical protein